MSKYIYEDLLMHVRCINVHSGVLNERQTIVSELYFKLYLNNNIVHMRLTSVHMKQTVRWL